MMKKARVGTKSPATADSVADPRDATRTGASFPIVGVGASAGGLEAFTALLKHLPLDTGMAFVLVQHLDPEHESALTHLLARATSLPVHEVTNHQRVEANHVYVIPRNTNLGIVGGILTLQPRPKTRAPHRSIDFFFEALAADQRERAIAVILSGTATDGTVGMEAIKGEGGITFAQDDSARYDSMPRSAVAAGCVDFVLSPEHIAHEIARIAKHPYVTNVAGEGPSQAENDRASATAHEDDDTPLPSGGHGAPRTGATQARAEAGRGNGEKTGTRAAEEGFRKILLLLRNHAGVDFSFYKSNTIQRRITRRMVLTRHETPERYAQFLRGNSKELDALYSDVLISVTSFFRNPEAFDVLQRKVWPTLLQQGGDDPIRVWTLGCSTGQEAYSIAMAFVEAAANAPRMRKLQVFATDLNDVLLDKARHGLYAKSIAQDLSPERLRRFFVEEEGGYRVSKALREMVVFARQNVISDPPFSRMDIISCRNLLIYFESGLQKKVFPVFHYALKPGGYLYLGASESIGGFTELFEPVDKKYRIYVKKPAPTPAFQLPARKGRGELKAAGSGQSESPLRMSAETSGAVDGFRAESNAQREADRISVNRFAPPAVLVNAELQILQFRGPTGAYLEPSSGKASFDVLKMARAGLMLPLRAAINEARRANKTVRKEHVRIEQDGNTRTTNLEVIPLKNLREPCFLIVFEDAPKAKRAASIDSPGGVFEPALGKEAVKRPPRGDDPRRTAELESDLAETRDYLQSIQEQHEAANEELQAANEEVQSANEELQSLNEELETSKEELESSNEELTTVNEEMANRNAELIRLNSDLVNIQTSAHMAIVLLSRDLTIRRFSAPAEKRFDLVAADVGRSFGSIRHNLDLPDLTPLITDVIDTIQAHEREVQDKEGRWYSLRVRPYLTLDNKVDGAVLVLVDIDALKNSEQAMAAARDYAENIIATVREPLLVLDRDLRIETANRAFYDTFRTSAAETVGQLVFDLGNHQWDIPGLRKLLKQIVPENHTVIDFRVEHTFRQLGPRTMLLNGRRMHGLEHGAELILLAFEDVTERTQTEKLFEERRRILELIAAGEPQKHCLEELCLGIERIDPRVRACVLLTNDQRTGFSLIIAPRFPKFVEAVRDLPIGDGWAGTCAQVIVGGQPVTCADVANDDRWMADWKSLCLAHGIHAAFSSPVIVAGESPQGSVFLCFDVPKEPTQGDRRLADVATDLVAAVLRRDRANETLRKSEERYRSLTEAITSVTWTTDAEGRVVTPQPSWSQYTGQTWEELRDLSWTDALHPDDRDGVRDLWAAALKAHTPYYAEGRMWHAASGAYRHFEARGVPVLKADGSIREWIGQYLDVDDRKRGAQDLRESEDRYRTLFELGPVAVYSCDASGVIQTFNRRAAELWRREPAPGDTDERFCGSYRLFRPDGSFMPHEQCPMAEVVAGKIAEARDAEVLIERPDGSRVTVVVNIRPLKNQRGEITGAINCFYDITDRKRAEDALRESDRHKTEFLAMLAHELRNPLAPILASIEIMHRAKNLEEFEHSPQPRTKETDGETPATNLDLSKRVNHALDVLRRQVGQMVRLVDDLLDAGRVSSGKIDLRRKQVELSSVVQQSVEAVRPLVDRRGQELTVVLPQVPVLLDADPTRLIQIIGNLLNNSCKFTARGGRIELTAELTENSGTGDSEGASSRPATQIVFRVRDNGVGIAADRLEGIFGLFMQIDTTTEQSSSGLGIGLALVKTLAELHGGTVEATSSGIGHGTKFTVRLPIVVAAGAPESPPRATDLSAPPLRILIVDDNRDAADMLAMLLNLSGHETHTAHDGVAAVAAASTLDPDVILLDIGLPKLNGYEAARRIREQRKGNGRPVLVALTGLGQDEDRLRSEQAGFNAHVVKPVDGDTLGKLLVELGAGNKGASP